MHFVIAMMNHGGCIVFVGSALPFFNVFLRGYWLLLQSRGPLSSGPSTWPTSAQPWVEPPMEKGGPEVTTGYSLDFIVSTRNLVGFNDFNVF